MQVTNIAAECVQIMNIRKMVIDLYGINCTMREALINRFYKTDYANNYYISLIGQPEKMEINFSEVFRYIDEVSGNKLIPNWLNFMLDLRYVEHDMDDIPGNLNIVDYLFRDLDPIIDKFYTCDNRFYINLVNQAKMMGIDVDELLKYLDQFPGNKLIPNRCIDHIDYENHPLNSVINLEKFRQLLNIYDEEELREDITMMYESSSEDSNKNYMDIISGMVGPSLSESLSSELNPIFVARNTDLKSTLIIYNLMMDVVNKINDLMKNDENFKADEKDIRDRIISYFPKEISDRIFKFNSEDFSQPWLTLNLDEIDKISETSVFYLLIMQAIIHGADLNDVDEFEDPYDEYMNKFYKIYNYYKNE